MSALVSSSARGSLNAPILSVPLATPGPACSGLVTQLHHEVDAECSDCTSDSMPSKRSICYDNRDD